MHKVYCIFDSKVGAYLNPLIMRSAGEAVRAFGQACNQADHDFYRYAEDYTLFEIGTWDEITGTFQAYDSHISLCRAIEVSRRHQEHYFGSKPVPKKGQSATDEYYRDNNGQILPLNEVMA